MGKSRKYGVFLLQLIKKFHCYGTKKFSTIFTEHANGPSPEPVQISTTSLSNNSFNTILPSMHRSPMWSLSNLFNPFHAEILSRRAFLLFYVITCHKWLSQSV